MELTPKQLKTTLIDVFKAKLVPMVVSSPGLGKSDIFKQIAKDKQLKLIDIRLSQSDPTDLLGFPFLNGEKAEYKPMNTFPVEGDAIPEGYRGWLILLDEFNSAPMSVQAAAYKLVLDRMVGQHKLHPKTVCAAAGNLITDGAIVNRLSTAMQSRLIHLKMKVSADDWLEWANENNIDYRIKAFIGYNPNALQNFKANHIDATFACSRTWFFLSKLIINKPKLTIDDLPLMSGTISKGMANEFLGYCEVFEDLVQIQDIINSPENTSIPEKKDVLFALSNLIAAKLDNTNITPIITYVERLPVEFQIISLKYALKQNNNIELLEHPALEKWMSDLADKLI